MMLIIVASCLILLAVVLAKINGSLLSPPAFFAGYWGAALLAPLLLLRDHLATLRGVSEIALYATLWALAAQTALMGEEKKANSQQTEHSRISRAPLHVLVTLGAVSGLAAAVLTLQQVGFGITNALSFQGVFQTGNALAVARYSDGFQGSLIAALLLSVTYAAALVGPFAVTLARMNPILAAAPLISAIVYSTLTTARLVFLIAAALTVSSYVVARLVKDGRMPRLELKRMLVMTTFIAIVAGLFVAIALVRVGNASTTSQEVVSRKMQVYALGYLPAYSQWREADLNRNDPLALGASSIAGLEVITGESRDAFRSYDERVPVTSGGLSTNVYTIWRNIKLDFGLSGGLVVVALWGWATGRLYATAARRKKPASGMILSSSYSTILLSQTMPITSFTNVLAAMVGATIVIGLASRSGHGREDTSNDLTRNDMRRSANLRMRRRGRALAQGLDG